MRPPKTEQSALRNPLNRILGSEANVRVVRELVLARVPLARTDLAARAGLSIPGVSTALEKLREAGAVEFIGTGRRQAAQLREEHPLHTALLQLFQTESVRVEALVDALREVANRNAAVLRAAWLEGPFAEGTDQPNEPVLLGVLVSARRTGPVTAALRPELADLGRRYDVTVEPQTWTEADLATVAPAEEKRLRAALPLLGPPPLSIVGETGGTATAEPAKRRAASHSEFDYQSLLSAAVLAEMLTRDPTLPRRARSWIVQRMHRASEHEEHELAEWLELLDTTSIPRLQHVLLDSGERSTRLRQSNPFVPVLSEGERAALRKAALR